MGSSDISEKVKRMINKFKMPDKDEQKEKSETIDRSDQKKDINSIWEQKYGKLNEYVKVKNTKKTTGKKDKDEEFEEEKEADVVFEEMPNNEAFHGMETIYHKDNKHMKP